jgi:hypothetical protein
MFCRGRTTSSLLEPKNENKFYEPGVATLEAMSTTGPSEDIQLCHP